MSNQKLSAEEKRALQVMRGKVWQISNENEPDKVLFEGTKTQVYAHYRKHYKRTKGITISKIISEDVRKDWSYLLKRDDYPMGYMQGRGAS